MSTTTGPDEPLVQGEVIPPPTMVETECQFELEQSVVCVQTNPDLCGCFMDTSNLAESFPKEIRRQFYSAQAWLPPTDQYFCEVANQRVCQHYDVVQACCCNEFTTLYRECFINKYLVLELPIAGPCTAGCDSMNSYGGAVNDVPSQDNIFAPTVMTQGQGSDEGRNGKTTAITLGILLGALLFTAVAGGFFMLYRRNRAVVSKDEEEDMRQRGGIVELNIQDASFPNEASYHHEFYDIEGRTKYRGEESFSSGESDKDSEDNSSIPSQDQPRAKGLGSKRRDDENFVNQVQVVDLKSSAFYREKKRKSNRNYGQ